MNKTLERPESMVLSEHLRNTAEGILTELKQIQLKCRCASADPKKQDDLISMKELMLKLNHAKKLDVLINGMYKTA